MEELPEQLVSLLHLNPGVKILSNPNLELTPHINAGSAEKGKAGNYDSLSVLLPRRNAMC